MGKTVYGSGESRWGNKENESSTQEGLRES